jgi:hypothetical protein
VQAVGFCKRLDLVVDVRRFSESTNHEDVLHKSANSSRIILAAASHKIRCMKTYLNLDLAAKTSLAHLFLKELVSATKRHIEGLLHILPVSVNIRKIIVR